MTIFFFLLVIYYVCSRTCTGILLFHDLVDSYGCNQRFEL